MSTENWLTAWDKPSHEKCVRITECPDMTSAVYCGLKQEIKQTNQKILAGIFTLKFKHDFVGYPTLYEMRHKKTCFLYMQKQRPRSAAVTAQLRAIPEKNTWGGKTAGDIFFYGWSVRTFFKLYGSLVFDKF